MKWRKLPHPHYGNFGGRTNTSKVCCEKPIDEMDTLFKIHDIELSLAENKYDKYLADYSLFQGLKEISIKKIKIPIYGHLYFISCLFIFGVVSKFSKPKEKA